MLFVTQASLIIPVLILEWSAILIFFSLCVWFEMWVIFEWGGCRAHNEELARYVYENTPI